MKEKRFRPMVWLLVLPLLFCSCLLPQEESMRLAPVVTNYAGAVYTQAAVQRGDIEKIVQVNCMYLPVDYEEISVSDISLPFSDIYFQLGDTVEPGDLIAQQDCTELEEALAASRAAYDEAEMMRRHLEAERDMRMEQQRVLRAQVSATERENMQTVDEIREQYDARIVRQQDIMDIQEMRIAEYEEKIRGRKLIASIHGTITYMAGLDEKGVITNRYAKYEAVVSDIESSYFRADTEYYAYFKTGNTYTVTIRSGYYEIQVVDPAEMGGTVKDPSEPKQYVYFKMLTPDTVIESGDYASLKLTLDSRHDVLYLKNSAITRLEDGRSLVYMIDDEGMLHIQYIETGFDSGSYTEILSGLAEGDQAVIKDSLK